MRWHVKIVNNFQIYHTFLRQIFETDTYYKFKTLINMSGWVLRMNWFSHKQNNRKMSHLTHLVKKEKQNYVYDVFLFLFVCVHEIASVNPEGNENL